MALWFDSLTRSGVNLCILVLGYRFLHQFTSSKTYQTFPAPPNLNELNRFFLCFLSYTKKVLNVET